MATVPSESLEIARDALVAAGRDIDAFRFDYQPFPRLGCGAGPPPADVIVTNTATGIHRVYPAGPRSNWLGRFLADVDGGAFWS